MFLCFKLQTINSSELIHSILHPWVDKRGLFAGVASQRGSYLSRPYLFYRAFFHISWFLWSGQKGNLLPLSFQTYVLFPVRFFFWIEWYRLLFLHEFRNNWFLIWNVQDQLAWLNNEMTNSYELTKVNFWMNHKCTICIIRIQ